MRRQRPAGQGCGHGIERIDGGEVRARRHQRKQRQGFEVQCRGPFVCR
jgi:hypothetical protein